MLESLYGFNPVSGSTMKAMSICAIVAHQRRPRRGRWLVLHRLQRVEEVAHQEILERRLVLAPRRQRNGSPETVRAPREIFLFVFTDDRDHLAHDRDADIGVVAQTHVDLLRRTAADILVPTEERELGIVIADVRDLEHAAAVLGLAVVG